MAVTLQQIADKAGVSRGTVDRALNNRGRIRPEVAEKIKKIADEMGYKPNRAGKALALTNRSFRIGVIIQESTTPFMMMVRKGVDRAKDEIENLGGEVLVRDLRGINTKAVMEILDEFREKKVQAIAINPANNHTTRDAINHLVNEENIPVITLNTDIEDSARMCYVGQNAFLCGRAAAGMMGELIGGKGTVGIVSGYESNPSIRKRGAGFYSEMKACFPEVNVLAERFSYNSNAIAEMICSELIEQNMDLRGLYITSAVEQAVCTALERHDLLGKIKVLISDITPGSEKLIAENNISFAILQDPDEQGYLPVMMLFEYLFDGKKPEKDHYYADLTIVNRYNVDALNKHDN